MRKDSDNTSGRKHNSPASLISIVRVVASIAILGVGIFVALSPGLIYAPAPKIVLYCLISFLPAILFGAEAVSKFELKLPGFAITAFGAAALSFGFLMLLTYLTKPQQQIAVFHVLDESRQPITNLDREGVLEVPITDQGLSITRFVDGNTIILIFPEQVGECLIRIRPSSRGVSYSGKISYSGNRESELILGKNLRAD